MIRYGAGETLVDAGVPLSREFRYRTLLLSYLRHMTDSMLP